MFKRSCILVGASVFAATAAQAQIANGSFETGTVDPGATFVTLYGGDTSITGWTVIGGVQYSIDYIGGYWQASDGQRSVDLSGNGQGGLYQDVLFDPGWYTLSFDVAGNPDGGPIVKLATFSADSYNEILSYTLTGTQTLNNMEWSTWVTQPFYSDGMTRVSFVSATNSPYGMALDNVSANMVPEPATWAMMLIGFAALGSQIRRRRKQLSVTYA